MVTKPHPVLLNRVKDGTTWEDILKFITAGYSISVDETGNHILTGPKVVYGPTWIPEAFSQPIIHPRMAILHTNAGPVRTAWQSLWRYILRTDISLEMHFDVQMDGVIANLQPLNRRADCNYKANSFYISGDSTRYGAIAFETQDNGYASLDFTPWSVEQSRSIINALTCLSVCYGILCTAPPSWNDSGIGHHVLFPNDWTNVAGKTCPGKARIRQMDYIRSEVANNLAGFINATGWKCGSRG